MLSKNAIYIKGFYKGSSIMSAHFIDYYEDAGRIFERSWGNGGESIEEVDKIPENISGYNLSAEPKL